MKQNVEKIFNTFFEDYPALSVCKNDVKSVYEILENKE